MIELEEKRIGVHIVIDYFSATFPFICYEEDSEYSIVNDIILMACNFLILKKKMFIKKIMLCIDLNINISCLTILL